MRQASVTASIFVVRQRCPKKASRVVSNEDHPHAPLPLLFSLNPISYRCVEEGFASPTNANREQHNPHRSHPLPRSPFGYFPPSTHRRARGNRAILMATEASPTAQTTNPPPTAIPSSPNPSMNSAVWLRREAEDGRGAERGKVEERTAW